MFNSSTEVLMTPPAPATRLPIPQLLTLAGATFLVITAEMLPAGVLQLISKDLGVSESYAGYLMSGYAFTVVVTCIPLTHLTRNIDRTRLLRMVIVTYLIGTFLTVIAPTYWTVMGARIFTGIAHGLFWAIISAYPAYLVAPNLIPRAVVYTSVGGSIAFILGVPLSTWMGQQFGWRTSLAGIGVGLAILLVFLYRLLPLVGTGGDARDEEARQAQERANCVDAGAPTEGLSAEAVAPSENRQEPVLGAAEALPSVRVNRPRVLIRRQSFAAALGLCFTVALYVIGQYTAYTYISVIINQQVGVSLKYLALVLLAAGLLGFGSSLTSGRMFERFGNRMLVAMMAIVVFSLGMLWMIPFPTSLGIFWILLWNAAAAFIPSFFVMRLLNISPTKHRDLLAAIYNACFNFGIGGGAFTGGWILSRAGIGWVVLMAACFVFISLVATLLLTLRIRRSEKYVLWESQQA
ncbi:hypothetical protein BSR29_02500 [Boudabousia liubingyangii]|uniref:Major facilitator superfamily (MFS) profile domain-containing protein n=1 Tax=Boudabousia liubingyangii TaxID=1921764 RepID=A0A1Q5PQT4_9ACTO|nr:MFS transporter [Boudabousia liubingyangii]OKL49832.1 hypothetical protein BSR29_02500 [Boudabousia liubingyangii]